jgi:Protein of unknown function (DUF4435)
MGSLSYSSKALDTLPLFHRKKFIVYVEGQDDVIFWESVLKRFDMDNYQIKVAGGVSEIDKYTFSIVNDGVDIVVARDCDYSDIMGKQFNHPRVIYTYGYSIENSLYCPANIANAIAIHSRTLENHETDSATWLTEFVNKFERLLILDVANEIYGRGVQVLGNNCCRFLNTNSSHLVSEDKVRRYVATIEKGFAKSEVSDAQTLITKSSKEMLYIIRGHFLTNAVANYIRARVYAKSRRRIQMSAENLYIVLVSHFVSKCERAKDMKYLKKQIERLKSHMV